MKSKSLPPLSLPGSMLLAKASNRTETAVKSEIIKLEQQLEQLVADIAREEGIVSDANTAVTRLSSEHEHLSAMADTTEAIAEAAELAEQALAKRADLETQYNELTRQMADRSAAPGISWPGNITINSPP